MGKKCNDLADVKRTQDTLFDGRLFCLQHADGYRFSIDPVLLAHFVRLGKDENVLDLGAGCGILGLILLYRAGNRIRSLTAFELQAGLAELARDNIKLNQFQNQMQVMEGDLCDIKKSLKPEAYSTVVCNPPFYPLGGGRPSCNKESEIARHQVTCTLADVLKAAATAVKNRGRIYLIYPADGLGSLFALLPQQGLTAKRLQLIYSYPDTETGARLLLLEAMKNGGEGLEVLPPFYIYDKKNGNYSEAMQQLYESS
ncbi:MAG TPA: tRNA1(Val) (adenine(37)-N6)-methyltransferase [Desulfobacterales bacterium]|nr:tRNA1(Val) (adenine(37)-N6)-methyltransferase [Desulfobacterales bacterium]HIP38701.1 tRNA1(Val) (adenine(37)-N6)-methyltransferase [Desulfocapsa sulfexigens]